MRAWVALLLALLWAGAALAQQVPGPHPNDALIETLEDIQSRRDTPDPGLQDVIARLKAQQNAPVFDPMGVGMQEGLRVDGLDEVITRYDVDIEVFVSGDMMITETLDVVAAGKEIRRGIFRELPARYTFMGVDRDYVYDLIEVTRDGEPETVTQFGEGNAVVWRTGRREYFLRPGAYRYQFRYRVDDAIRRFKDRDELYWNAIGHYSVFPVETARISVTFPDGADITDLSVYTGRIGSQASNATTRIEDGTATIAITRPLAPREGVTVSASIAKGVVADISEAEKREFWWLRNGAVILLGLGGLGLLGFYGLMWMRVGRDPARPPVFARYEPPDGYGPAAVHYIYHRGHRKMTALSAQLLEMGAQGTVEIEANTKTTRITQTGPARTPDAKLLLKTVMGGKSEVVFDGKPDKTLFAGTTAFARQIAERYGRDYYRRNLGWAILGILASVALVVIVFNSPVSTNGPVVALLFLALAGMNLLFLKLLPAPTPKGSKVHAAIEGFRLYLNTAEKDRINTGGPLREEPPLMSVELYERFLPYAVALGVEKNWTKYFKSVMPKEAAEYRPTYAHGSRIMGRGHAPIDVGQTIAKAMTTGVAAAAPVSQSSGSGSSGGWSSGSSGGGFSGGGGGGGGVGGW